MPRPSKPFLRKQTKSWYCSIAGKQIPLGKDREVAFQKFHELMAEREQPVAEIKSLFELSQVYLDWCQVNRKPTTYKLHRHFLQSFIKSVGRRLRPSQLKVHHVTKWQDSLAVSTTTQNDAISVVKRMLNWGIEQNYITRNPIASMRKPPAKRRDIFYTSAQWQLIRKEARGPLLDLLDFLYSTGCRPQEARAIEARHLHGDLVIFPAEESKGGRDSRVIYLAPGAKEILDRLAKLYLEGKLFRNSNGCPWTKDAIKCRLTRISAAVGFRVIAYGARHSFATEALINGGVDPISVAHLMGHKDATMVSRVYSHIARNPDFLRQQALKAAGARTMSSSG